jgi:hypothetical protein
MAMNVFRFRRYGRSTAGRIMAGLGVGTREMRRAPLINRPVRDYFQLWSPTYDLSPLQVVLYRPRSLEPSIHSEIHRGRGRRYRIGFELLGRKRSEHLAKLCLVRSRI